MLSFIWKRQKSFKLGQKYGWNMLEKTPKMHSKLLKMCLNFPWRFNMNISVQNIKKNTPKKFVFVDSKS